MDLEAIAKRISEILEAEGNRPFDLESVESWRGYDVKVTPWSIEVTCIEHDDRIWTLRLGGRKRFRCTLSGDELTPAAHKVLAAVVAMMVPVASGAGAPCVAPALAAMEQEAEQEVEQDVEQHGLGRGR